MKTRVIWGPEFVTEALFGIGLSYGLTSEMEDARVLSRTPMYEGLMKVARRLAHRQGGHNKFLETIMFSLDVDAPRYWWQEFDTYRVGVTKQSESTMHAITKRPLTSDDFEGGMADIILHSLNSARAEAEALGDDTRMLNMKRYLPESFLQRRIVCLNAKALQNMYNQRKNHRLPEWRYFFDSIFCYLISLSDDDVDSALVRYCIFGDEK